MPLGLCLALLAAPGWAVEKSDEEPEEEKVEALEPKKPALGFVTESNLKKEPGSSAFFFLRQDVPWPEKNLMPPSAKPQTPAPVRAEPQPVKVVPVRPPVAPDSAPVAAAHKTEKTEKSNGKAASVRSAAVEKSKPEKKSALPLPDIEKLLADVRRSAKPKMAADLTPSKPAVPEESPEPDLDAAPAPVSESSRTVAEVEAPVDLDDLARDLETFQKTQTVPAAKKMDPGAAPRHTAAVSEELPWWMTSALASVTALAGIGIFLWFRRRQKLRIRPQSAIDAETKAYFKKLYAQHRRQQIQTPAAAPPPQIPISVAADIRPASPPEPELSPLEEPQQVFLLPPELAEGAYKEAVMLAGLGETVEEISKKLNLGEGEVRLVLDIARMSRPHPA